MSKPSDPQSAKTDSPLSEPPGPEALLASARALVARLDAIDRLLEAEQSRLAADQQNWQQLLQQAGLDTPEKVAAYVADLSADQRRDAELAGSTPL